MGTRPPKPAAIATAVIFALSVFGFTMYVWNAFGGSLPFTPKGYRFHVRFGTDAVQLWPNAQARISGVKVGKVITVEPKEGRIDAEIELERKFAPIPADSRAILRFKTLLGEAFIELTPGSKNGPKLPEGGILPVENVQASQGLDEVLGSFDPPTRAALKKFLNDLATALEDRGPDLNAAIGNAGPAVEELRKLVESLDRQRPALRRLLRDTGRTLDAVGSRPEQVQTLVTSTDQVLQATAARNRELTETVRALPPFLRELRSTLTAVEGTAADAAPTLRALAPVAPLIRPALLETSRLAPELELTLKRLNPVITRAQTGLPAATRIVNALRPLINILYPAARELIPVVDMLKAYRRELVMFAANIGAVTQASVVFPDGVRRHYARLMIPLSNELPVGQAARQPTNRHNPYPRPGLLDTFATGLEAWDCRNTANAQTLPPIGSAPADCKEMAPWEFRGATRSYPHVEIDGP